MMPPEEEKVNFKKIGIIVGIIVVVVIAGVVIFKKIKAKKEAAFLEADDSDDE